MKRLAIGMFAALACMVSGGAAAETLQCPELSTLVEVGACPGEEDLRYTFRGYCSDNQRMYDKEQLCLDFETYRAAKNVSLWESADGRFTGYLKCESGAEMRRGKATGIEVRGQGGMKQVVCSYGSGLTLTHRTRARCVAAHSPCGGDGCSVECE